MGEPEAPQNAEALSPFEQVSEVVKAVRLSIGLPLVVAAIVSLLCDVGESFDLSLYSTIAQIAPVFLLAMLLSELFMLRRFMSEIGEAHGSVTANDLARLLANEIFALFAAVEVPALIALSLGHSTTFLGVWTLLALVAFFFAFRRNQVQHFVVGTQEILKRKGG